MQGADGGRSGKSPSESPSRQHNPALANQFPCPALARLDCGLEGDGVCTPSPIRSPRRSSGEAEPLGVFGAELHFCGGSHRHQAPRLRALPTSEACRAWGEAPGSGPGTLALQPLTPVSPLSHDQPKLGLGWVSPPRLSLCATECGAWLGFPSAL